MIWLVAMATFRPGLKLLAAAVRPRGFQGKPAKEVMRAGIQMLYGMDLGDLDQNVIDAIAVGHCHLCRTEETGLDWTESTILVCRANEFRASA